MSTVLQLHALFVAHQNANQGNDSFKCTAVVGGTVH